MGVLEKCWYKNVCKSECTDTCIRYLEMQFLMDSSGLPENKQTPEKLCPGSDLENFQKLQSIKDSIESFVVNGNNLLLTSPYTGNGKTSWAIKLLLKYFDKIWAGNGFKVRGLFVHVPTLLLKLKNFNDPISEEYKDNLINVDLVVWDDIGSVNLSAYDSNQLLALLDTRLATGKSNIYTTNLDESSFEKFLGQRLKSRIWNTATKIELKGRDRRG